MQCYHRSQWGNIWTHKFIFSYENFHITSVFYRELSTAHHIKMSDPWHSESILLLTTRGWTLLQLHNYKGGFCRSWVCNILCNSDATSSKLGRCRAFFTQQRCMSATQSCGQSRGMSGLKSPCIMPANMAPIVWLGYSLAPNVQISQRTTPKENTSTCNHAKQLFIDSSTFWMLTWENMTSYLMKINTQTGGVSFPTA